MRSALRALLSFSLIVVSAAAARAQTASVPLSPNAAEWHDTVEVRIEGSGCTGATAGPFVSDFGIESVIDIDLEGCHPSTGQPFSTVVELGPLYPLQYTVRVHDAIRHIVSPPPPPLATATLNVYFEASLDVDVPEPATDAAPFAIVLRVPAPSSCFSLDPPVVQGKVIEAAFDANCPILPASGPNVFTEVFELGPLPAGEYDVRFFEWTGEPRPRLHRETLTVHDADACVPSDTALCLQNGRFRVEAEWEAFQGQTGPGHAIPLADRDDSGLLWFFQPDNVELTVKVLDGCNLGGHWWVFLSSSSTVRYTVTVTDTTTGQKRIYANDLGESAALISDTSAFACAP